MRDEEWARWCEEHMILFGFNRDADADMMARWRRAELLGACSLEELLEASVWLAGHEGGAFRTAHADLLRRRVMARRAERARLREEAEDRAADAAYQCPLDAEDRKAQPGCHGSGLLSLPHPRSVAGGVWLRPYYRLAVACECARGARRHADSFRAAADSGGKAPCLWSLAEYEARVPDWRRLLRERAATQRAQAEERYEAERAHARAGPIDMRAVARNLVEKTRKGADPCG